MFSRAGTERPLVAEEEVFPVTADERLALSVTLAVMVAAAGLGVLLPASSIPPSSSIVAVTIPVAQAEPVAPAAPSVAVSVDAAPAVLPVVKPSPSSTGCSQQSWPYVCAEGAGDVRRVRVVSTDRNAPASVVVSVQEQSPDVRATAEDASPAGVSQILGAPNSAAAEFLRPVNNAALPVAAADVPVKVSATFMPAPPAAQVKPAVRNRTSARKVAQKYPARHRTPAAREEASAALAYGAIPHHRVESYPWADAGFR